MTNFNNIITFIFINSQYLIYLKGVDLKVFIKKMVDELIDAHVDYKRNIFNDFKVY